MCNNAMTYNSPETLYYQAAKKLLNFGLRMIQKVKKNLFVLKTIFFFRKSLFVLIFVTDSFLRSRLPNLLLLCQLPLLIH